MNLLLDTHVAIWALTERRMIAPKIMELIMDPSNVAHVSAVSVWEIAIKFSLKKRDRPPFSGRDAIGYFNRANFRMLNVTADHASRLDDLPKLHTDPFDRLLVAQALVEPMRLVSRDAEVVGYSESFITW